MILPTFGVQVVLIDLADSRDLANVDAVGSVYSRRCRF